MSKPILSLGAGLLIKACVCTGVAFMGVALMGITLMSGAMAQEGFEDSLPTPPVREISAAQTDDVFAGMPRKESSPQVNTPSADTKPDKRQKDRAKGSASRLFQESTDPTARYQRRTAVASDAQRRLNDLNAREANRGMFWGLLGNLAVTGAQTYLATEIAMNPNSELRPLANIMLQDAYRTPSSSSSGGGSYNRSGAGSVSVPPSQFTTSHTVKCEPDGDFNAFFTRQESAYPRQSHWGMRDNSLWGAFLLDLGLSYMKSCNTGLSHADFEATWNHSIKARDAMIHACEEHSSIVGQCTPTHYPGTR